MSCSCRYLIILTFLIFSVHSKPATLTERISHLIFPGTNWCGLGNIAKNYDDLGPETQIDSCCREHDLCPEEINSGETKYGLYNKYFISRLHCNCDKKLYDCLKNSSNSSQIAGLIGNIYFNILQYPCFSEKCPDDDFSQWGNCTGNDISEQYQWYDTVRY